MAFSRKQPSKRSSVVGVESSSPDNPSELYPLAPPPLYPLKRAFPAKRISATCSAQSFVGKRSSRASFRNGGTESGNGGLKRVSFLQQEQGVNEQIVANVQDLEIASLKRRAEDGATEMAVLQHKVECGNLEWATWQQKVDDRDREVANLEQRLGEKEKEIARLQQQLAEVEAGEAESRDETVKCKVCSRPNLYKEDGQAREGWRWLSDELMQMLADMKVVVEQKQLEDVGDGIQPLFQDVQHEKGDVKDLVADILVSLREKVVEKESEVSEVQVWEGQVQQQMKLVEEATAMIEKKDEALSYYNQALQACESQVKEIQSKCEASECQAWAVRHKLEVVGSPMRKIWIRCLLENVRRQIAQDLSMFAHAIAFEEQSYPHAMKNWNATLSKLYQTPDACALLASKGLQMELLEITRVGAHYQDGLQTLQHIGNAAASIARRAEVAEAICSSKDLPESQLFALKQLYRYVYGSNRDTDVDCKEL